MVDVKTFHEERLTGIGGSEAAKILGVSPWGGAIDVYMEKVGLINPAEQPETERQYWGKKLEPLVRDRYEEEIGLVVDWDETLLRHAEHDFMIAHIDGTVVKDDGPFGLEVKTTDVINKHLWGDGWTDEVPNWYNVQCQHYMAVTGFPKFHLAVLFGGNDFRIYEIKRHTGVVEHLIQKEGVFWNRVQRRDPPEIDGSVGAKKFLLKMYPKDSGKSLVSTPDFDEHARMYMAALGDAEQAKETMELYRQQMQQSMGDNSCVDGDAFRVTWKYVQGRRTFDHKAAVAGGDLPQGTVDKHTKVGEPTRRFLFKRKEG
jgi:putative phage-type endonuclease